jgi:putative tricarboxylic transport membrane protein
MDFLGPFVGGLSAMTDPMLWVFVLIGTLLGVLSGAMPGIGTTLAYGLVLPFTFVMAPVYAVAFLLGISVGVMYGNSIPAILMAVPGNPAAILTVIDGHALQKQGEGGLALAVSLVSSLVGQTLGILMFVLLLVPLRGLAYAFQSPELFALFALGMIALVSLSGKNILKGGLAALFGIFVAIIGLDPINNSPRYHLDTVILRNGLDVVPVVIGLLALSELIRSTRQLYQWGSPDDEGEARRFPKWGRFRRTWKPTVVGSIIGTFVGAIPGAGATPAAMISYQQAQFMSKTPEEFGNGSIEGVAVNEAAQNASNAGELIPTLGLGIPGSGSMVLLLTALTVHGFTPGPRMMDASPQLLHAAIAGMFAAVIFLAFTGWFMASAMMKAVSMDRAVVLGVAIAFVSVGLFSLNGRAFDVFVAFIFGIIGYYMHRYGYSVAAASLAVVLGKGFEQHLRQGLSLTQNDWWQFLSRPITGITLLIALMLLVLSITRRLGVRRVLSDDIGASGDGSSTTESAPSASNKPAN